MGNHVHGFEITADASLEQLYRVVSDVLGKPMREMELSVGLPFALKPFRNSLYLLIINGGPRRGEVGEPVSIYPKTL